MDFSSKVKPKEASLGIVITRKDGTVEDLGIVSYYHRNPLRRWYFYFQLWLKLKNKRKG